LTINLFNSFIGVIDIFIILIFHWESEKMPILTSSLLHFELLLIWVADQKLDTGSIHRTACTPANSVMRLSALIRADERYRHVLGIGAAHASQGVQIVTKSLISKRKRLLTITS